MDTLKLHDGLHDGLHEVVSAVDQNISACCAELLEYNKTGILPDGKIKEIAKAIVSLKYGFALDIVLMIIKDVAVMYMTK